MLIYVAILVTLLCCKVAAIDCTYVNTVDDSHLFSLYNVADVFQSRPGSFYLPAICPSTALISGLNGANVWDTRLSDFVLDVAAYTGDYNTNEMIFIIDGMQSHIAMEYLFSTSYWFDIRGSASINIHDWQLRLTTKVPGPEVPADQAVLKHSCQISKLDVDFTTKGADVASSTALTAIEPFIRSYAKDLDYMAEVVCDGLETDLYEFLMLNPANMGSAVASMLERSMEQRLSSSGAWLSDVLNQTATTLRSQKTA